MTTRSIRCGSTRSAASAIASARPHPRSPIPPRDQAFTERSHSPHPPHIPQHEPVTRHGDAGREMSGGRREMKKPLIASILAFATLLTACGGATPAATSAPSGGATAAADPCAVPVKGKCPAEAQAVTGAGATFPGPLYTKWIDQYNTLTGVQINYQAVGSGGGIKNFTDKTVDFGASDVPLTDAQIDAITGGLYLIPMALGSVVPTYNIPNVTATVRFTPEALAGIYLEQIKKWNDPKITAENPGVT